MSITIVDSRNASPLFVYSGASRKVEGVIGAAGRRSFMQFATHYYLRSEKRVFQVLQLTRNAHQSFLLTRMVTTRCSWLLQLLKLHCPTSPDGGFSRVAGIPASAAIGYTYICSDNACDAAVLAGLCASGDLFAACCRRRGYLRPAPSTTSVQWGSLAPSINPTRCTSVSTNKEHPTRHQTSFSERVAHLIRSLSPPQNPGTVLDQQHEQGGRGASSCLHTSRENDTCSLRVAQKSKMGPGCSTSNKTTVAEACSKMLWHLQLLLLLPAEEPHLLYDILAIDPQLQHYLLQMLLKATEFQQSTAAGTAESVQFIANAASICHLRTGSAPAPPSLVVGAAATVADAEASDTTVVAPADCPSSFKSAAAQIIISSQVQGEMAVSRDPAGVFASPGFPQLQRKNDAKKHQGRRSCNNSVTRKWVLKRKAEEAHIHKAAVTVQQQACYQQLVLQEELLSKKQLGTGLHELCSAFNRHQQHPEGRKEQQKQLLQCSCSHSVGEQQLVKNSTATGSLVSERYPSPRWSSSCRPTYFPVLASTIAQRRMDISKTCASSERRSSWSKGANAYEQKRHPSSIADSERSVIAGALRDPEESLLKEKQHAAAIEKAVNLLGATKPMEPATAQTAAHATQLSTMHKGMSPMKLLKQDATTDHFLQRRLLLHPQQGFQLCDYVVRLQRQRQQVLARQQQGNSTQEEQQAVLQCLIRLHRQQKQAQDGRLYGSKRQPQQNRCGKIEDLDNFSHQEENYWAPSQEQETEKEQQTDNVARRSRLSALSSDSPEMHGAWQPEAAALLDSTYKQGTPLKAQQQRQQHHLQQQSLHHSSLQIHQPPLKQVDQRLPGQQLDKALVERECQQLPPQQQHLLQRQLGHLPKPPQQPEKALSWGAMPEGSEKVYYKNAASPMSTRKTFEAVQHLEICHSTRMDQQHSMWPETLHEEKQHLQHREKKIMQSIHLERRGRASGAVPLSQQHHKGQEGRQMERWQPQHLHLGGQHPHEGTLGSLANRELSSAMTGQQQLHQSCSCPLGPRNGPTNTRPSRRQSTETQYQQQKRWEPRQQREDITHTRDFPPVLVRAKSPSDIHLRSWEYSRSESCRPIKGASLATLATSEMMAVSEHKEQTLWRQQHQQDAPLDILNWKGYSYSGVLPPWGAARRVNRNSRWQSPSHCQKVPQRLNYTERAFETKLRSLSAPEISSKRSTKHQKQEKVPFVASPDSSGSLAEWGLETGASVVMHRPHCITAVASGETEELHKRLDAEVETELPRKTRSTSEQQIRPLPAAAIETNAVRLYPSSLPVATVLRGTATKLDASSVGNAPSFVRQDTRSQSRTGGPLIRGISPAVHRSHSSDCRSRTLGISLNAFARSSSSGALTQSTGSFSSTTRDITRTLQPALAVAAPATETQPKAPLEAAPSTAPPTLYGRSSASRTEVDHHGHSDTSSERFLVSSARGVQRVLKARSYAGNVSKTHFGSSSSTSSSSASRHTFSVSNHQHPQLKMTQRGSLHRSNSATAAVDRCPLSRLGAPTQEAAEEALGETMAYSERVPGRTQARGPSCTMDCWPLRAHARSKANSITGTAADALKLLQQELQNHQQHGLQLKQLQTDLLEQQQSMQTQRRQYKQLLEHQQKQQLLQLPQMQPKQAHLAQRKPSQAEMPQVQPSTETKLPHRALEAASDASPLLSFTHNKCEGQHAFWQGPLIMRKCKDKSRYGMGLNYVAKMGAASDSTSSTSESSSHQLARSCSSPPQRPIDFPAPRKDGTLNLKRCVASVEKRMLKRAASAALPATGDRVQSSMFIEAAENLDSPLPEDCKNTPCADATVTGKPSETEAVMELPTAVQETANYSMPPAAKEIVAYRYSSYRHIVPQAADATRHASPIAVAAVQRQQKSPIFTNVIRMFSSSMSFSNAGGAVGTAVQLQESGVCQNQPKKKQHGNQKHTAASQICPTASASLSSSSSSLLWRLKVLQWVIYNPSDFTETQHSAGAQNIGSSNYCRSSKSNSLAQPTTLSFSSASLQEPFKASSLAAGTTERVLSGADTVLQQTKANTSSGDLFLMTSFFQQRRDQQQHTQELQKQKLKKQKRRKQLQHYKQQQQLLVRKKRKKVLQDDRNKLYRGMQQEQQEPEHEQEIPHQEPRQPELQQREIQRHEHNLQKLFQRELPENQEELRYKQQQQVHGEELRQRKQSLVPQAKFQWLSKIRSFPPFVPFIDLLTLSSPFAQKPALGAIPTTAASPAMRAQVTTCATSAYTSDGRFIEESSLVRTRREGAVPRFFSTFIAQEMGLMRHLSDEMLCECHPNKKQALRFRRTPLQEQQLPSPRSQPDFLSGPVPGALSFSVETRPKIAALPFAAARTLNNSVRTQPFSSENGSAVFPYFRRQRQQQPQHEQDIPTRVVEDIRMATEKPSTASTIVLSDASNILSRRFLRIFQARFPRKQQQEQRRTHDASSELMLPLCSKCQKQPMIHEQHRPYRQQQRQYKQAYDHLPLWAQSWECDKQNQLQQPLPPTQPISQQRSLDKQHIAHQMVGPQEMQNKEPTHEISELHLDVQNQPAQQHCEPLEQAGYHIPLEQNKPIRQADRLVVQKNSPVEQNHLQLLSQPPLQQPPPQQRVPHHPSPQQVPEVKHPVLHPRHPILQQLPQNEQTHQHRQEHQEQTHAILLQSLETRTVLEQPQGCQPQSVLQRQKRQLPMHQQVLQQQSPQHPRHQSLHQMEGQHAQQHMMLLENKRLNEPRVFHYASSRSKVAEGYFNSTCDICLIRQRGILVLDWDFMGGPCIRTPPHFCLLSKGKDEIGNGGSNPRHQAHSTTVERHCKGIGARLLIPERSELLTGKTLQETLEALQGTGHLTEKELKNLLLSLQGGGRAVAQAVLTYCADGDSFLLMDRLKRLASATEISIS
ncbi:hypothetical protein cyc_04151 [Cyclospora cayetanensis]|uniref:Uncharacterized protein n=1 Tax=Cyclospora cayetanensis TaxID=88456 RepID=A0A1D3CWS1_9EIME|nr:hypothetical protein cyc_04151 [Cyclospora cayetanensis]